MPRLAVGIGVVRGAERGYVRCRPLPHPLIVAAIALALTTATACSGSPTTETAPKGAGELARFLVRGDEVKGFPLNGEPQKFSPLSAWVDEADLSEAEERRLRAHGFQAFVVQHLGDPESEAGVSNVTLFATKDGATRELEYLANQIDKDDAHPLVDRFDVPGVASATGWTAEKPENDTVVANVHWSQGRCVMGIGTEPAYIDRVRAGVKAVYERTEGRCP